MTTAEIEARLASAVTDGDDPRFFGMWVVVRDDAPSDTAAFTISGRVVGLVVNVGTDASRRGGDANG